jgi:hypothetical protein
MWSKLGVQEARLFEDWHSAKQPRKNSHILVEHNEVLSLRAQCQEAITALEGTWSKTSAASPHEGVRLREKMRGFTTQLMTALTQLSSKTRSVIKRLHTTNRQKDLKTQKDLRAQGPRDKAAPFAAAVKLTCGDGAGFLSWDAALSELSKTPEALSRTTKGRRKQNPLSRDAMRCAAECIRMNGVSSAREVGLAAGFELTTPGEQSRLVEQLLSGLPVMLVRKARVSSNIRPGATTLIVDLTNNAYVGFVMDCHSSLFPDSSPVAVTAPGTARLSGQGRPPMHKTNPKLVSTVRDFMDQNEKKADPRRRTSTIFTGVSMPELRLYVLGKLDIEVSERTLRRLGAPRNKQHKSAVLYKSEINFKVAAKKNDGRHDLTGNGQASAADINVARELFAMHESETVSIGIDTMNKIKVGPLAVSRYHQIKRVYMVDDFPQYDSHDFPVPGYHLDAAGVLDLCPTPGEGEQNVCGNRGRRARSLSRDRKGVLLMAPRSVSCPPAAHRHTLSQVWDGRDRHGRLRKVFPTSGKGHVYLRACKFYTSNITKWVHAIHDFMQNRRHAAASSSKPVALLIQADGGPDCTPESVSNIIMYGRLWMALDLAVMAVLIYASGLSALGAIEHLWSPLSTALTGVQFSACVEGEDTPPVAQSGLDVPQRRQKEARVFDTALKELKSLFKKVIWCGHKVRATVIPCSDAQFTDWSKAALPSLAQPTRQTFGAPPRIDDYGLVHDLHKAGAATIRDTPAFRALREEQMFYLAHLDRGKLRIVFTKCRQPQCACNGAHEPWQEGFLKDFTFLGSRLPTVTPSENLAGHYKTLLDHFRTPAAKRARSDTYLPSRIKQALGWCCAGCKSYAFTSKTDRKDHMKTVHGALVRGTPKAELPVKPRLCVCGQKFLSNWYLKTHQNRCDVAKKKTKKKKKGRFSESERLKKPPTVPAPPLMVPEPPLKPTATKPGPGHRRNPNLGPDTVPAEPKQGPATLKVPELKAELKARNLSVEGLKAVLVARLKESIATEKRSPATMKVLELKAELKARDLSVEGLKAVLLARLEEVVTTEKSAGASAEAPAEEKASVEAVPAQPKDRRRRPPKAKPPAMPTPPLKTVEQKQIQTPPAGSTSKRKVTDHAQPAAIIKRPKGHKDSTVEEPPRQLTPYELRRLANIR